MQIIQISASYKPAYIYGGPTMSVSKLSEELCKAGTEVQVLTTTANGVEELDVVPDINTVVDGVPVFYFKRITKDHSHFSPALLFHLFKLVKRKKAPLFLNGSTHYSLLNTQYIIHIHAWWNLVSIFSCVISLLKSQPVLLSPRGTLSNYSFGNRKSLLKNIFHKIIGRALLVRCHFHVTSEKEKQDILNLLNPKSITVIPNFVNLEPTANSKLSEGVLSDKTQNSKLKTQNSPKESFRTQLPTENCQLKTENSPFNLLFLSRIEEKKGLDILFRALKLVQIPWHLTIAGTGKADYILFLKSLADELQLSDRIIWIGQQDNEQKFSVLAQHDLMILPSHDENFANIVIESLSVGTPVLISSNVGLADYVSENQFGWVCSTDEIVMADTIWIAYLDLNRRSQVRQNAPSKIRIGYDDKNLIIRYTQMYNDVVSMTAN
jgi:glycosyltransferase involved in cell wall biosynthesis